MVVLFFRQIVIRICNRDSPVEGLYGLIKQGYLLFFFVELAEIVKDFF